MELTSLAAAAKLVGRSVPTVRTYIRDGKVPGARKLPDGSYRIPQAALIAAFPGSGRTRPDDGTPAPTEPVVVVELERLRAENALLRDNLRDLRVQLEHERAMYRALVTGQLGAGPTARKRWWRRSSSVPAPMEGPTPERGEQ